MGSSFSKGLSSSSSRTQSHMGSRWSRLQPVSEGDIELGNLGGAEERPSTEFDSARQSSLSSNSDITPAEDLPPPALLRIQWIGRSFSEPWSIPSMLTAALGDYSSRVRTTTVVRDSGVAPHISGMQAALSDSSSDGSRSNCGMLGFLRARCKMFCGNHGRTMVGLVALACSAGVFGMLLWAECKIDKEQPKKACGIWLVVKKYRDLNILQPYLYVGFFVHLAALGYLVFVAKDGCCNYVGNVGSIIFEIAVSTGFTFLSLLFTDGTSALLAACLCIYIICICNLARMGNHFGLIDGALSVVNYAILSSAGPKGLRAFLLCLVVSVVNVLKYHCLRKGGDIPEEKED